MPEFPNPLTLLHALELWREAAAQEIGIRVPIRQADIERIKNIMYGARKTAVDREPHLKDLMLCVAPGAEEVWIVRRPKEAP